VSLLHVAGILGKALVFLVGALVLGVVAVAEAVQAGLAASGARGAARGGAGLLLPHVVAGQRHRAGAIHAYLTLSFKKLLTTGELYLALDLSYIPLRASILEDVHYRDFQFSRANESDSAPSSHGGGSV